MDNQSYNKTIEELEETLSQLKTQTQDFVELTERAMGLCGSVMMKFRESVLKNGFNNEKEEIYFFKHIKPKVESKFIFYTELFQLEANRPDGGKKHQLKYFRDEIKNLCVFQKENKELYYYMKRNKVQSDQIYFLRGNLDSRIHEDNISCHTDPNFCTGYDKTIARIMAYKQLGKYISKEIKKLKGNEEFVSDLYWTNFNIDALELVYALSLSNAINHGKASRIEIARAFEKMFNMKFKDIYGTFGEMRGRSDQISFLKHLIEVLQKRMDDMDE
ncbi:RteC domain-containing protein [uncultured Draconibacterium sp.]|uniref:RteC domain-containing protein n=1 Tax=uncultured Draconibacterium sp. TaxID=1573823 RepID=UPI002AA7B293|nr:RteC domain-containing protein [uncultured Draconibacterium sp.]